jgi:hypothetical protein
MQHLLYVARSPEGAVLAALGIALGPSRGGSASCRSALLLPRQPSKPVLHDWVGLSGTEEQLRGLAFGQAGFEALSKGMFVVGSRFEPAPWFTLQRWVLTGRVTRAALAAVVDYLGNAPAFDWLDGSAARR